MGKLATLALKPYPCTLVLKTLKRGMPDDVDGLTTLLDDGDIVVDIRDDLDPDDKLLICVHEAVHVVQFVQQRVETEIDEETAAYLTQTIVGWMVKRLKIATSTQQSGKQK